MEKQCSKCDEVKPISEFGKKRGKVGGMSWCKVCENIRSKKKYDPIKKKQYRLKNKEVILKQKKEYYELNKEEVLERNKQFLINNPNYLKDRYNERYHNDSEYRFGYLISSHLKGVKNRQDFKDLWDEVRKDYDEKGISYHIDHLIPKSWFKVGSPKHIINHLDNLQVIDANYNMSKQDRWSDPVPSEYLDKIRPYIKKKYEGLLYTL